MNVNFKTRKEKMEDEVSLAHQQKLLVEKNIDLQCLETVLRKNSKDQRCKNCEHLLGDYANYSLANSRNWIRSLLFTRSNWINSLILVITVLTVNYTFSWFYSYWNPIETSMPIHKKWYKYVLDLFRKYMYFSENKKYF